MKIPAQADMQRWSDDVARDPRSLAFLPLARVYRRQGMREASMQLCLRGLEAYPSHIEAHGLLALLYLEAGDHQKAADEWSMVLRIDPDNFDALRGLGFCYLEQDQLSKARQMLERAALLRPADGAVQEALRVLGTRQELVEEGLTRRHEEQPHPSPPLFAFANTEPAPAEPARAQPASAQPASADAVRAPAEQGTASATNTAAPPLPADPTQLFDDLLSAGPVLGALLVDAHGLVLAGRLPEGDADMLGAVLGGAIGEATRTVTHLQLGDWRGIVLDAEHALLHISPASSEAVVVLAARRGAPAGWLVRVSAQAAERASRFLQEYA